jgi:hypothetical protein
LALKILCSRAKNIIKILEVLSIYARLTFMQARSLLSCGLCERLIDPNLLEDYKKEEMETMMFAARLCLSHSSPERPTMEMVLLLSFFFFSFFFFFFFFFG